MDTSNPKFYSPADLAKRYGVSKRTIARWTDQGYLPQPHRIGTQVIRYDALEIIAMEASGRNPEGNIGTTGET